MIMRQYIETFSFEIIVLTSATVFSLFPTNRKKKSGFSHFVGFSRCGALCLSEELLLLRLEDVNQKNGLNSTGRYFPAPTYPHRYTDAKNVFNSPSVVTPGKGRVPPRIKDVKI
jgi:hypothetical protein